MEAAARLALGSCLPCVLCCTACWHPALPCCVLAPQACGNIGGRAALTACCLFRAPCLQKMAEELFSLPLEEALPILRAYGHYLK